MMESTRLIPIIRTWTPKVRDQRLTTLKRLRKANEERPGTMEYLVLLAEAQKNKNVQQFAICNTFARITLRVLQVSDGMKDHAGRL